MGAIQNFKNRQLEKQRIAATKKPTSALTLLAKLLQVEESDAIATAEKYIASNINFFADLAEGDDKTVTAKVKTDEQGNIEKITDIAEFEAVKDVASELNGSAANVESSASSVENSADNISEAASDLAYTASDITNAAEEIKEATAELKKPRAPRKSSTSKSKKAQKSSSKK